MGDKWICGTDVMTVALDAAVWMRFRNLNLLEPAWIDLLGEDERMSGLLFCLCIRPSHRLRKKSLVCSHTGLHAQRTRPLPET